MSDIHRMVRCILAGIFPGFSRVTFNDEAFQ